VNTVELDEGPEDDELTDPDTLVAWFAERGLCQPGARATQAELERAIVVREGPRWRRPPTTPRCGPASPATSRN
jgi:hypothetical protein